MLAQIKLKQMHAMPLPTPCQPLVNCNLPEVYYADASTLTRAPPPLFVLYEPHWAMYSTRYIAELASVAEFASATQGLGVTLC